jgi:hypothetical protein
MEVFLGIKSASTPVTNGFHLLAAAAAFLFVISFLFSPDLALFVGLIFGGAVVAFYLMKMVSFVIAAISRSGEKKSRVLR